MMSKSTPITEREMAQLLDDAIGHAGDDGLPSPDDEQVALLLEGRVDELSEMGRDQLLRQIAASPEAGEAVAAIGRLGGRQVGRSDGWRIGPWVGVAWAAAACLVVSLGAWRLADPPQTAEAVLQLQALDASETASPSQQQRRAELAEQIERGRQRDWALGIGGVVCVALTIPVAIALIRRDKVAAKS
jgi:hypothetical protein